MFSTYLSIAARDKTVQTLKDLTADAVHMVEMTGGSYTSGTTLLFGPNWVIHPRWQTSRTAGRHSRHMLTGLHPG